MTQMIGLQKNWCTETSRYGGSAELCHYSLMHWSQKSPSYIIILQVETKKKLSIILLCKENNLI